MLDEATKSRLRQRLEEQRQQLMAELNQQDREVKEMTADEVNENTYSNHMDDVGSHLQEIDRISAVESNAQDLLRQVENALRRMDEGTYGLSEVSGKEIPVERLEAIPYATRLLEEEANLEVETLYNKHTPGSIEPGAHM
jgi:RNA polymerase-binding transcription factor DksA